MNKNIVASPLYSYVPNNLECCVRFETPVLSWDISKLEHVIQRRAGVVRCKTLKIRGRKRPFNLGRKNLAHWLSLYTSPRLPYSV